MKKALEKSLPAPLFSVLKSGKAEIQLMLMRAGAKFRKNDQIFSRIYQTNGWGGTKGEFYSGPGSYEQPIEKYINLVREFIVANKIHSVVDLGCGDFNIGQKVIAPGIRYTGVDVVEPLINRNNQLFGSDNVSFRCLDIAQDELPNGTLCTIRQVFQHLSNANIKAVLPKLRKYKFVLVTEHYPSDAEVVLPNKDIPTGADIRARWRSGVYLDKPPFNVKNIVPVFEFKSDWTAHSLKEPTIIRTFLIS
jgi:SAM-dependent methyltransferase